MLHGQKLDTQLPHYGNKVIGVTNSKIDIHGERRAVTWTTLSASALKGANEILLQTETDWRVGDVVVVPSTSWDMEEAEVFAIEAVLAAN